MSVTLSFYAFEPGPSGVPASSATGVFVNGLVRVLTEAGDAREDLRVQMKWLRPAERWPSRRLDRWLTAARWTARELGRMLRDHSRYILFIYPKVPVLAHVNEPTLLGLAAKAYWTLRMKARLTRQRLVVVVEDLPIEMAEGKAVAGGPTDRLPVRQIRGIERSLFRAAHRLIVPHGFVETIRELHGIDEDRIRTFHRNIYLSDAEEALDEVEYDGGKVNFFYSGSIDASLAPNFREILRSIRNAPDTRLHVCGPGADSVRSWFAELDVPNAHHYGQLSVAAHDHLAQRCDIGLILYPTDNPYNNLTPTMKYSAYIANGLAILSTDLKSVGSNVERDKVGRTMPIAELSVELLRWATRPKLWAHFKSQAQSLTPVVRSADEMEPWIREIAAGG